MLPLARGKAELAAYSAKVDLGCRSTLSSEALAAAPPGRSVVASCPTACDGPVFGSFIYAPESSICAAAAHAGLIADDGGSVVVTVGYGQDFYFGSAPPWRAAPQGIRMLPPVHMRIILARGVRPSQLLLFND